MDQLNDINWATWVAISELPGMIIPKYVSNYTPLTKEAASKISESLFADDIHNNYPIDNKPNTWLSSIYFEFNKQSGINKHSKVINNHIEARLAQASNMYGVSEDIKKAVGVIKKAYSVKDELPNYITWADGKHVYPIYNINDLEKAAQYFKCTRNMYKPAERKEVAKFIIKKAQEFDTEIQDKVILAEAGYGLLNREFFGSEILDRAKITKNAEVAAALANLNILINEVPEAIIEGSLEKIADVIEEFDSFQGIDKEYGKTKLSPAEMVYSMTIKQANDLVTMAVKLGSHFFDASKLASVFTTSHFEDLFGKEFASKVSKDNKLLPDKLAEELNKLPEEDKLLVEEYIKYSTQQ